MNRACEVWNRVIVQSASAMLHTTDLPINFWGQAALCAVYLLNRSPTKGLQLKQTPYEALYGQKPYIGHIRTWGCRAYAHITKESNKQKKWDSHSRECILMGFYDSENMFKLYNVDNNAIIKIRDVIFFEHTLGHDRFKRGKKLPTGQNIKGQPDVNNSDSEPEDPIIELVQPAPHLPAEDNTSMYAASHHAFTASAWVTAKGVRVNMALPTSYKNAMKSQQSQNWKKACEVEIDALTLNNTWTLVKRTPGMQVINSKWVFNLKWKEDGTVEQYKACLVARGDCQVKGVNFDKVYAPVVRFASLRILLHLAAVYELEVEQGDFCNAFLNGVLNDANIFMTQPEGFVDKQHPDYVCHLNKSLYGLRQAARVWYGCLNDTAAANGLQRVAND